MTKSRPASEHRVISRAPRTTVSRSKNRVSPSVKQSNISIFDHHPGRSCFKGKVKHPTSGTSVRQINGTSGSHCWHIACRHFTCRGWYSPPLFSTHTILMDQEEERETGMVIVMEGARVAGSAAERAMGWDLAKDLGWERDSDSEKEKGAGWDLAMDSDLVTAKERGWEKARARGWDSVTDSARVRVRVMDLEKAKAMG